MKKFTIAFVAVVTVFACVMLILNCRPMLRGAPRLTVAGTGVVQVQRDRAVTSIAVSVLEPTATGAMNHATNVYTTVRDAIIAAGAKPADLTTTGISVSPEYSYFNTERPVLLGYRSVVSVQIETAVDVVAKVLDTAVTTGGDYLTIAGITFTNKDTNKAADTSRIRAIADAKNKAKLYAQKLGLDVRATLKVLETSTSIPSPIRPDFDKGGGEGVLPIDAGNAKVSTSVEVTFLLG